MLTTSTPTAAPAAAELASPQVGEQPPVASESKLVFYAAPVGWRLLDLGELWRFREVLYALVARDLKVRYRHTLIGVAWVVLQPLATMAVFVTLFGLLGRQPASDDYPYTIVVLAGLVPWQVFAQAVTQASGSLANNANLLTKVYFPRIILPLVALVSATIDGIAAGVVLLAAMMLGGVALSPTLALAPLAMLPTIVAALGIGLWLSALHARYRDVAYVLPFVMQITFFLSPVVYETRALVPESWRWLHACHPLVGAIDVFRWSVLGQEAFPWLSASVSCVVTAGLLLSGLWFFRNVTRDVADRL